MASRGIFNALYTGLAGAMVCHDALEHGQDLADYADDIRRIQAAFEQQMANSDAAETR